MIDQYNAKIYDLSKEKLSLKGMGTTLCCLYLYEDSVIYAHVGDSRIYRYRNKELKQLTQDHTLFQESYAKSATKHIITRAIGTCNKVEPEISLLTVQQEDLFFMCTDGLSDFVSVQEMESFSLTTILNPQIRIALFALGAFALLPIILKKLWKND